MNLLYDCYEKKAAADVVDDKMSHPRQPLADFVKDFLLTKFGVGATADPPGAPQFK